MLAQPGHRTTIFRETIAVYERYREVNHIGKETGTGWIARVGTFLALLMAGDTSGLAVRARPGDVRA